MSRGEVAVRPVLYQSRRVPGEGYIPPRNTMDPRYDRCVTHHVACDCREAEHAEELAELRAEVAALRTTVETMWRCSPLDMYPVLDAEVEARWGPDGRELAYRRALYRVAAGRMPADEMREIARRALNGKHQPQKPLANIYDDGNAPAASRITGAQSDEVPF